MGIAPGAFLDCTVLNAKNAADLRNSIVQGLVTMLQSDPLTTYEDTTKKHDIGSLIEFTENIDGEWCVGHEQYVGNPSKK
jgi:hypothetical protein